MSEMGISKIKSKLKSDKEVLLDLIKLTRQKLKSSSLKEDKQLQKALKEIENYIIVA